MVTIPYYEIINPTEEELDILNKMGQTALSLGYRFHGGKWLRKTGATPASDSCAEESRKRPLTLEEIKNWPE